jgi:hypothetical protein
MNIWVRADSALQLWARELTDSKRKRKRKRKRTHELAANCGCPRDAPLPGDSASHDKVEPALLCVGRWVDVDLTGVSCVSRESDGMRTWSDADTALRHSDAETAVGFDVNTE